MNGMPPASRQPEVGCRILVCLDRSPSSEGCLPSAIALARTLGGSITLVHVLHPHRDHRGLQPSDALGWEISRQEARSYLRRLEQQVAAALGRSIDSRLEQGQPAERIVELARELDADITVLGSRGEGGDLAWFLGSTAQQVLTLARNSVFIAHSASSAPVEMTPRRILVPLDGSQRAESVLPVAARMARTQGAEMLVVHVVQEPLPTTLMEVAGCMDLAIKLAARLQVGAKRYLERIAQQLLRDGAAVRTLVLRHANAQQCLLEIARREQADLVMLSAHGSTCDSVRSFGSVTAHLLSRSTVSMLVLQDLIERDAHPARAAASRLAPPSARATHAAELA